MPECKKATIAVKKPNVKNMKPDAKDQLHKRSLGREHSSCTWAGKTRRIQRAQEEGANLSRRKTVVCIGQAGGREEEVRGSGSRT